MLVTCCTPLGVIQTSRISFARQNTKGSGDADKISKSSISSDDLALTVY